MPRVTVYHLTPPKRLPLIEEEGLKTRAELSGLLGEPGELDQAAPGTFAHGKRVSAYHSLVGVPGSMNPFPTIQSRMTARNLIAKEFIYKFIIF